MSALMLSGGQALEAFAGAGARRDLPVLLERAPRVVHCYENGQLASPPIDKVRPGYLLMVKPGEVVPVDGLVEGEVAVLDESALTGESKPVERSPGEPARNRTINAASPFQLRAVATARGEHLCRHRPPGAGGRDLQGSVRALGRPLLPGLPAAHPGPAGPGGDRVGRVGEPVRALAVLVVATPLPARTFTLRTIPGTVKLWESRGRAEAYILS